MNSRNRTWIRCTDSKSYALFNVSHCISKYNDALFINKTSSRLTQVWNDIAKKALDRIKQVQGFIVMTTLEKNDKDITINLQWGFHISSILQTCDLNNIGHVIYFVRVCVWEQRSYRICLSITQQISVKVILNIPWIVSSSLLPF